MREELETINFIETWKTNYFACLKNKFTGNNSTGSYNYYAVRKSEQPGTWQKQTKTVKKGGNERGIVTVLS